MPTRTFTLGQYVARAKGMAAEVREAARRGLVAGGSKVLADVVHRTDQLGAVSSGFYRSAWKGYSRGPDEYVVENSAPYAGVLEYGRRPGRGVSAEGQRAIALWVRRKLGVTDERKARGIAYVIARNMKQRGWPGPGRRPYAVLTEPAAAAHDERTVRDAIEREVAKVIG